MLIGIIGKKESGKDTLGDYLVNNYQYQKYSFALPLKKVCKELFLLDDEQLINHTLKETIDTRWGLSPRQMLQKVGTDLIRNNINENFWILHFKFWYNNNKNNIVITDCRFQNEVNIIKELGGIVIKLNRNTERIDTHISEDIDKLTGFDYTLDNNSTKEQLYKSIDTLLN